MQQRKSGVTELADKLPLAKPRFRRLDGRGREFRDISGIRRLAAPKHSEPTRRRRHRRSCLRCPNLALPTDYRVVVGFHDVTRSSSKACLTSFTH